MTYETNLNEFSIAVWKSTANFVAWDNIHLLSHKYVGLKSRQISWSQNQGIHRVVPFSGHSREESAAKFIQTVDRIKFLLCRTQGPVFLLLIGWGPFSALRGHA